MADDGQSLTGVWHGLYTYLAGPVPTYFVATLIDTGIHLSGTTHEADHGETGLPLTLYAMIDGTKSGRDVHFTKTYDGSGGWSHAVAYDGTLNETRDEIEGRWSIPPSPEGPGANGRFLMIRSSGASESVVRRAYERA